MSASAILSPVTAPLALSSAGAKADAAGMTDDFAAYLPVETAEAASASPTPTTGIAPDTAAPSEPIAVETRIEDTGPSATEGSTLPIWLQVVPNAAPTFASTDAETIVGTRNAPQADTGQDVAPSAADLVDPILPKPLQAATIGQDITPSPVSDPNIPSLKAGAVANVAPVAEKPTATDAITPVPNRAFAEAALASLRALPGAGVLQQASVAQRKTDATTISNAIDDGAAIASVDGKAPVLGAPATTIPAAITVADSPKIAPDGPLAETSADIVEILPLTSDLDAVAATTSPSTSSTDAATATPTDTSLSSLSRATIETTTALAAQISGRLASRSTRFELGLTPEGLGRVDVTLDIDTDGQLSARLAFDNPLAATELRGRADELRRQLEDAGFTLARDALDFSTRDDPSGGGTDRRQQRASAYADRHAAQTDLADAPPAWTLPSSRLTPQGVDVKV